MRSGGARVARMHEGDRTARMSILRPGPPVLPTFDKGSMMHPLEMQLRQRRAHVPPEPWQTCGNSGACDELKVVVLPMSRVHAEACKIRVRSAGDDRSQRIDNQALLDVLVADRE